VQTSAFAHYPVAVPYSDKIVREKEENVKKNHRPVGGKIRFHACDFFLLYALRFSVLESFLQGMNVS